jgi:hypothetical protein
MTNSLLCFSAVNSFILSGLNETVVNMNRGVPGHHWGGGGSCEHGSKPSGSIFIMLNDFTTIGKAPFLLVDCHL